MKASNNEITFTKKEIMLLFGSMNIVHSLLCINKSRIIEYNQVYDELVKSISNYGWFGDGG
jgi:hypothetical protein